MKLYFKRLFFTLYLLLLAWPGATYAQSAFDEFPRIGPGSKPVRIRLAPKLNSLRASTPVPEPSSPIAARDILPAPTQNLTFTASQSVRAGGENKIPGFSELKSSGDGKRAIIRADRIHVPFGVKMTFVGYESVILKADSVVIDGEIEAMGEDGEDGENGAGTLYPSDSMPQFLTHHGGRGGRGGLFANTPQGNGGGGGADSGDASELQFAPDGAGNISPGRARDICGPFAEVQGGIGASGGTNGTPGSIGSGGTGCATASVFGGPSFSARTMPAGGGSHSVDFPVLIGCFAGFVNGIETGIVLSNGAGGGSGGGGGFVHIEADHDLNITGTIRVDGGNGGNGGAAGVGPCDIDGDPRVIESAAAGGGGGGGGGAGGFILLIAGGTAEISGTLSARGGLGGVGGSAGANYIFPPPERLPGHAGGAGGGGRIHIIAARVEGIAASNGASASGRETSGLPTISVGPRIDEISFNYDSALPNAQNSGGTHDAINLGIDGEFPLISGPEYVFNTKDKEVTAAPYDAETIAPAAYLAGKAIRLKARLRGQDDLMSAVIAATLWERQEGSNQLQASPYGEFPSQTVSFTNGRSDWATFTSTGNAKTIAARDLVIRWQMTSATNSQGQTLPPTELQETAHRVYTVRKLPLAPAEVPWSKVLELTSHMAIELPNNPTDVEVSSAFEKGIHTSSWRSLTTPRFFTPLASFIYNGQMTLSCVNGTFALQSFPLTQFITRLSSQAIIEMQCNDGANLHVIMLASQGILATGSLMVSYPHTVPTTPLDTLAVITAGNVDPPVCHRYRFVFHQVSSLSMDQSFDIVAQASLPPSGSACILGDDSGCACSPGNYLHNRTRQAYLRESFENRDLSNTGWVFPVQVLIDDTCVP